MSAETMFHKIYLGSRSSLSRLVARIVPPGDVEDIVQETYVRLCQVENTDKVLSPKSFMYTIAKNLALDYKKQARNRLVDDINVDNDFERVINENSSYEPFQSKSMDDEFGKMCEAVRRLPVQCRKVFVLKKVYGYSQKEIALKLKLSESTIEKHISTGTKRCIEFARNNINAKVSLDARNEKG